MQSMQRKFGRMTTKKSADDSQVAILLKDFEDADMLLAKVVDSIKAWRDSWVSIATFQSRLADEFDGLYAPIVGSSETPSQHRPVETEPALQARTNRLRREYYELRGELIQELNVVEERMTLPAEQAKSYLDPMKKTIKKRNDKKSDFERSQSRVDGLIHKTKRTDRENASLAKAEIEVSAAKEVYYAADEDLRRRLPTLNSLLFSLAPHILRAQIEVQNSMLAHYYTVLHTFCEEEGLPSPPPPMDQVIQDWKIANKPAQSDIESLGCFVQGKAMRQAMANDPHNQDKRPSIASRTSGNSSRLSVPSMSSLRNGKPAAPPPMLAPKPCATDFRSPSPSSSYMTARGSVSVPSSSSTPPLLQGSDYYDPPPIAMPAPSPLSQPTRPPGIATFAPAGPNKDYFQSTASTPSTRSASTDNVAMAIASKKKRPPPPPRRATFVTALYDFGGHQFGDLTFREGDQIKIVRKTGSTDDWWEGELGGVKGAFPANYVE